MDGPRARMGVWLARCLIPVPFVLMTPEISAALTGGPDAVKHLSASTADVLGTSSFILFALMLAVTPLATVTGWRWHVVLRRDFGIAMFAVAATDLVLAAIVTGDTFRGGVATRIGGHTFLWIGTLSVALLVPLVLTANRRAQRILGRRWRSVQRLTYVVWGLVVVHLLLLFGFRSLARDALLLSAPLLALRVPAARRWWTQARREGRRRSVRVGLGLALLGSFAGGLTPFLLELVVKGGAAFHGQPTGD